MHLLEIRQSLENTSIEQDIYASSKILKKLSKLIDNSADLSIILLDKSYTIFKMNNKGV